MLTNKINGMIPGFESFLGSIKKLLNITISINKC